MKNKLNNKRSLLVSIVFLLSLFSFIYINCPAASGLTSQTLVDTEEEVFQERLSPEVAAVKFMLGIANFIITSDR